MLGLNAPELKSDVMALIPLPPLVTLRTTPESKTGMPALNAFWMPSGDSPRLLAMEDMVSGVSEPFTRLKTSIAIVTYLSK